MLKEDGLTIVMNSKAWPFICIVLQC